MVRKTATYFYLAPISSAYYLQHQVQALTRFLYSKSRYSTAANSGTNFIVTTGINISLNDAGRRFLPTHQNIQSFTSTLFPDSSTKRNPSKACSNFNF